MPLNSRRWIHWLVALPLLALAGTGSAAEYSPGYAGIKAFFEAAGRGDLAQVKQMLEAGIHPDAQNSQAKETALMRAAGAGQLAVVEALLAAGARPDKRDAAGSTALLSATASGRIEVVRVLLAAGADPEVTSPALAGRTPLMWSLGNGNTAMAQVLLDGGANVNARTSYGATPLRFAVWHDGPEQRVLVRRLLEAGADPDTGQIPSYKLPANPPLRSAEGTVLGNVAGGGSVEMVRILLEGGATVDARQPGWRTPLMMAAAGGHVEVVRMLLAAGADVAAKDSDGRTALDLALAASRAGAVALLQDAGKSRPAR